MMLLSVDTSSAHCVVTLGNSGDNSHSLFFRRVQNDRSHSLILLELIQNLLDEANISLQDLSGFAVAIGPGSFVGVRLGVSVIQGLADGLNLRVWPISSLRVLAQSYFLESNLNPITVVRDAHMGDFYIGEYECLSDQRDQKSKIVTPVRPDYIEKKREEEADNISGNARVESLMLLNPVALHQIAWESFSKESGKRPEEISPVYLRGANLWKKQK